jgi:glycosyltransferase involved in cell wall biosynthesis
VGSLARLKNLAGAIAAFETLAATHPTLRLVVLGARSPALAAPQIILPPAIADRIVFLGQVEDPAFLAATYRSARCLVFPSFYEASPLPPLEAMAEGCPVVASDLPALRERCGEAALYCDPHDAASIARSVTRVLDAPGLAESLRRRGTAQAGAFSWPACADATLAVLAEAACA